MPIAPEEVLKIAKLARIAVQEEELPTYAHDLSKILDFVSVLDGIDTESGSPMAHPAITERILRNDIISEKVNAASFQENAPEKSDGYYLVPQVIE